MNLIRQILNTIAATLICGTLAAAQSTSQSNPTPLAGEYTGKGPGKETNYYFRFTAGPGDVRVRLEVKAKDYSTFARIEIGNDPSNLIAMGNMNASTTTGAASLTREFTLDAEQSVRVKLTLDANLSEYTLSLNGGGAGSVAGGKSSITGKLGKLTAGGGSKIGAIGGGDKPKTGSETASGKPGANSLMTPSTSGKPGFVKIGGGSTGTTKPKATPGPPLRFTCPEDALYSIGQNGDWYAGLNSLIRIGFDSSGFDGQSLVCTYAANNGILRASAVLTRPIPKGYACTNPSNKSRDFNCKSAAAAQLEP